MDKPSKGVMDEDLIGLEHLIETNSIVMTYFWATWCGPCKTFSKVYEEVADQVRDLCFVKMKIDDASSEVMESLGIQSVPHLMIFKQGQVVFSESGTIPKSVLMDLIQQTKQLSIEKTN
jgi:thioredoxin 1